MGISSSAVLGNRDGAMRSDRVLDGLCIGPYGVAAIQRPAVFGAYRDPGAFVAEDRCLNAVFDGWAVAALQYRTQQTGEACHHIGVLTAWLRPEMLHYPLAYQLADAHALNKLIVRIHLVAPSDCLSSDIHPTRLPSVL